ncbi:MAG: FkbM family methyltransferase [Hyphomicrobiaceae bacterium]|nr:FkbM family methyltransferase [Hyphomicrobiaceae bacterium]
MSSTFLRPLALWLGYDLRTVRRSDSIDLNLKRYFAHHETGLVVDCGAHHGGFAKMARGAGYQGPILSFEPASANFAVLNEVSRGDSLWRVRHAGLGAANGQLSLNINAGSNFHSLLASNSTMTARFPALRTTSTEAVGILRLDDALAGETIAHDVPIFLKTDTQGHDLAVLEGAGARLSQIAAIMIEMPVQPIYEGAPDHWRIMATLRDAGYELYATSTVSRDASGGLIEYDAIWRRVARS